MRILVSLWRSPNLVPRNLLTHPMKVAATINPATCIMEALRSLILQDLRWETIGIGYRAVAVAAAIMLTSASA